jgi:hypothetical protein
MLFNTHPGEVSVCDYCNESHGTLFLSAAGFRVAVRVFSPAVSPPSPLLLSLILLTAVFLTPIQLMCKPHLSETTEGPCVLTWAISELNV